MLFLPKVFLSVCALLVATCAPAANNNPLTKPGLYTVGFVNHTKPSTGSLTGLGSRLGYTFGHGVGVELGFEYLGRRNISGAKTQFSSANAAAIYTLPLNRVLALRAGGGYTYVRAKTASASASDSAPFASVGAELVVGRGTSVLGEYRRLGKDLEANMYMVGVKLRF